jgi:hypothetical protein
VDVPCQHGTELLVTIKLCDIFCEFCDCIFLEYTSVSTSKLFRLFTITRYYHMARSFVSQTTR